MGKFLTLTELLANRPIKTSLVFGLNDNVRLTAISNDERTKEGQAISRNTYMTFTKYDAKNKIIGQNEFSYYNLDSTRDTLVQDLATQINQLTNIASIFEEGATLDPISEYTDLDELTKDLKNPKKCKAIIDTLYKQFEKIVKKEVGPEAPLMRMKVVVNKNNFVQMSNDSLIVEPMSVPLEETALRMSAYDRNVQIKALEEAVKPKTADATNAGPAKDVLASI